MTSCILTVIKNEHEYLDEWIRYHLDLGIDHIFIFEDIDSDSHKEITDKYSTEKVTLKNILYVFNNDERKNIIFMKQTKKYVLNDYIIRGLLYLQNEYKDKYDWCFVIDNDEFITLENKNDNLSNVLTIYKDYDAFMLQWICYGSGGRIHKPDYTNKGVIDTYTEKAKGSFNIDDRCKTKTCYNLKNFKHNFYRTIHQPGDCCNFCKSNLERCRYKPVYDTIFLRHYPVKSWEEFLWKVRTRGEFKVVRVGSLQPFFDINPDMEDKKEELIKKADSKYE